MTMKRKDFGSIKEVYNLPNLLDLQTVSYVDFLQADVNVSKRQVKGLQEAFVDSFPIESHDKKIRLEFLSYNLGRPKYNLLECKKRGMTYSSALRVKLRLITPSETKEQEVYFGEMPLMTNTGTFVINGDERVIVSQLQRSPGVCFEEEMHPTGKKIF